MKYTDAYILFLIGINILQILLELIFFGIICLIIVADVKWVFK